MNCGLRILHFSASMKPQALPVGSKLIEQEADLDRQRVSRTVTPESSTAQPRVAVAPERATRGTPPNFTIALVYFACRANRSFGCPAPLAKIFGFSKNPNQL
jgi:hypothetical protein